jgi:hypothetical protein
MDTWRKVVLQNFPEFGHHPKSWELAEAATRLGALLWQAAQAADGPAVQRVVKFLAWAEEQGAREEGLAWLAEDVLRRTVSAPETRAVLVSQLNERTLHALKRVIEYLTTPDVLAEAERAVNARRRGSAVPG